MNKFFKRKFTTVPKLLSYNIQKGAVRKRFKMTENVHESVQNYYGKELKTSEGTVTTVNVLKITEYKNKSVWTWRGGGTNVPHF